MAALSGITAVKPTAGTLIIGPVRYGATIAAGSPVYLDESDSKYKLADANASTATAAVRGIAITSGVDGDYGYLAKGGGVVLVGTTMSVGETYYIGPTAGQITPDADLTTGDRVSQLGTAASATQLDLSIKSTGIVHA